MRVYAYVCMFLHVCVHGNTRARAPESALAVLFVNTISCCFHTSLADTDY